MMRSNTRVWLGAAALALTAGGSVALGAATAPAAKPVAASANEGLDLFEKEVRPLLVAECQRCHGDKLQQGGLRLTTREAMLKGGANGPAVVPGDPGKSLVIQAVRHEITIMPPGKQLPEKQITALERWIKIGAPWPAAKTASAIVLGDQVRIFREAQRHWAYQPVHRPALPAVKNKAWVRNPIDAFVLARLEKAGMTPSPAADRRTLIRRVTYDLTGLPPTAEQVDAYVADPAPDAYEKLVDRLLASPQYGERWGRHWLDVARFADTKDGVLQYGDARIRPYAYTYRDYVIRAFNEDTPYDQFLKEQLAADQIQPPVAPWRLAAMGFLTLGRQFDNNQHDVIDDRIDTVGRGMMGLTLACARCHDHKYDAIPTADYYSLYGIFASCETPVELPLTDKPENTPGYAEYEKQFVPKKQQLEALVDQQYTSLSEIARQRVADYLVRVATTPPDPLETAIFFLSPSPEDLRPQIVARWRRLVEKRATPTDPIFGPWRELMDLPPADLAARSSEVLARWKQRKPGNGPGEVNPLVVGALAAAKLTDRASVAQAYGNLLRRLSDERRTPNPPALSREAEPLLALAAGKDSPGYFPKTQTYYYMNRGEKDQYGGMIGGLDVLAVQNTGAPPRAMVLSDSSELYDPRIFVRGNPSAPGDAVPRRFLKLLSGPQRPAFQHGSGRLDLANSIADASNPLTARVLVNRMWMHHFGEPLVQSPSDFGSRSTPPSHPELLDWMADDLVRGGWRMKRLHRILVLSNTYKQSSTDRPACRTKDPENKLLWRAHRRRLDFEEMRDTLLALPGRLDGTMFGRPVREAMDPGTRRRTVYCLVDRQSLPEVFRAFNFAQPDQSVERRPSTTVPQQALFALNSPFVVEQAKALLARPEVSAAATDEARIAGLYRLVLARKPAPDEVAAGLIFVHRPAGAGSKITAWEQYAQVLLQTNEVMYLD